MTAGKDKCVRFWDPMTLTPLAYIKEDGEPTDLFSFTKEPILFYRVGNKIHSFNYKKI